MNTSNKILIKLLSAAIRGRNPVNDDYKITNWGSVFKEAKAHHVESLIFPLIKKLKLRQHINENLMLEWEKRTLITGIIQMRHIKAVRKIISILNEAGIPVMVLKGLVLRTLYPRPELRTMSDADILVPKEMSNRQESCF